MDIFAPQITDHSVDAGFNKQPPEDTSLHLGGHHEWDGKVGFLAPPTI